LIDPGPNAACPVFGPDAGCLVLTPGRFAVARVLLAGRLPFNPLDLTAEVLP